ncbi:hypothetical protein Dimus_006413 [Dionaea muscipula]
MAIVEDNLGTLTSHEPNPRPGAEPRLVPDVYSLNPAANRRAEDPSPPAKQSISPKDAVASVASRIVSQPLPCSDPDVWGVLTAISNNSRKRIQGINMLLRANEHCIGRTVEDNRFQIESNAVSQRHCKIFRRRVVDDGGDPDSSPYDCVFLKDTSTNGTFVNWEKLKRGSSKVEAKLHHGDVISLVGPPHHELAFAFVYREVSKSIPLTDSAILKRKAEEFTPESKRLKGIGIGAPEGPLSLDDFRSLQRSNTELRKQLEEQVLTIDALRTENRAAIERHENERKELKESISNSYLDQVKELHELVETKRNELAEANKLSAEHKHVIEDLNERLAASMQSCEDANDIIKSQKASIAELESQLDEERDQRREEREKAAADMRTAIQRVQSEAQEALKRASDATLRRERELEEVINKLQESERDRSSLLENLRSKLEETREKLVSSDNKVRQLETHVSEEQLASASKKRRVDELELLLKRTRKELESEKSAREEAWAKVSLLELEINAAMRDLDYERRRFKGARERIMLRENQLRAFYSTTEEISVMFAKQQEQLKQMQRTLEDQENYDDASLEFNANPNTGKVHGTTDAEMEPKGYKTTSAMGAGAAISPRRDPVETSSDEASATEKHDCDVRSQDDNQNTQEAVYPNDANLAKEGACDSDIDGFGIAPDFEGDVGGTEHVSESPAVEGERNIDLNRCLGGDTMQLDDDTNVQDTEQQLPLIRCEEETQHNSQSDNEAVGIEAIEDTQPVGIRKANLEVAGSLACSTSLLHIKNESPRSKGNNYDGADAPLCHTKASVAERQNAPSSSPSSPTTRRYRVEDRRALGEMVGIIAPDLKEQFQIAIANESEERESKVPNSDSDTEDCGGDEKDNGVGINSESSSSDVDAEGDDPVDSDEVMDEDDDTQADSCG